MLDTAYSSPNFSVHVCAYEYRCELFQDNKEKHGKSERSVQREKSILEKRFSNPLTFLISDNHIEK